MRNINVRAMKPARLVLLLGLAAWCAGCMFPGDVNYVPDPQLHLAGWKCPSDQSHFVAHTNPPCTWIPVGILFKSCMDQYAASLETARGCTPEPAASPSQAAASPG